MLPNLLEARCAGKLWPPRVSPGVLALCNQARSSFSTRDHIMASVCTFPRLRPKYSPRLKCSRGVAWRGNAPGSQDGDNLSKQTPTHCQKSRHTKPLITPSYALHCIHVPRWQPTKGLQCVFHSCLCRIISVHWSWRGCMEKRNRRHGCVDKNMSPAITVNKGRWGHQAFSHCSRPQWCPLRGFRMGKNRILALES